MEVVLSYKGKEEDMVINYHAVPLLMTISKVLEKRMYSFITKNNIFFDSQYVFEILLACNHGDGRPPASSDKR